VADGTAAPRFTIPREVCRDFDRSSRLEWLDTNHTGAYAMGTVAGINTRRYHALLIASLRPPADRFSILPRVEEQLAVHDQVFELSTVQYPGTLHPRGFELLDQFVLDPFPIWRYAAGPAQLEKTVCLLDSRQSVLLRYKISGANARLRVRLFLAFRDYHGLARQNSTLRPASVVLAENRVSFAPYPDLPSLDVFHSGTFEPGGLWFLNHEYLRELDRGLDFREDLYSPGSLVFDIDPDRPACFIATLEPESPPRHLDRRAVDELLESEAQRRLLPPARRMLDHFRILRSDKRPSLIAGYPWFTDWSRDTLISLPALSAAGFEPDLSKQILATLLAQRSQGLLPNRFSDQESTPEYNSVDAALWMFVAAHELIKRDPDEMFLREILYPAARDILAWHFRGTLHSIAVDPQDRLLSAGAPDTQLTWMDARVNGVPVTPRFGKPVEINALWYNALRIAAEWAAALGVSADRQEFCAEAEKVLASFRAKFWNAGRGCLYDTLAATPAEAPDARLRPNQLFALSLPFPLLDLPEARQIVHLVERELLTPVGPRTLEPPDPAYTPRFEGAPAQRDAAYHQGTVWPWLIGPFVAAYLYAFGETPESLAYCRGLLAGFERELAACCLGSLSEVYDADPPQRPAGCPAQLWSVAQFLLASARAGVLKAA
jgi:predicted glycogen debranching enzyme